VGTIRFGDTAGKRDVPHRLVARTRDDLRDRQSFEAFVAAQLVLVRAVWVVTAAEVFVVLSGVVLGMVYGRRLAR
jgi:hypothetical protein